MKKIIVFKREILTTLVFTAVFAFVLIISSCNKPDEEEEFPAGLKDTNWETVDGDKVSFDSMNEVTVTPAEGAERSFTLVKIVKQEQPNQEMLYFGKDELKDFIIYRNEKIFTVNLGGVQKLNWQKEGFDWENGNDTDPTEGLLFSLINNNTAYSVSKGTANALAVVIPPTYNNLPVTMISYEGFKYYAKMTSITIPDSVTSIGESAFSYCSRLTSITIPDNVTSISSFAFSDCDSLTDITISNSVKVISSYTFQNCSSLPSVTIPDSVTKINDGAFQSCSSLTSVTIPASVTNIGDSAFAICTSLDTVNYGGTEEQWYLIIIENNNSNLTNAERYYAGEKPEQETDEPVLKIV
jgi:hypothetical protein